MAYRGSFSQPHADNSNQARVAGTFLVSVESQQLSQGELDMLEAIDEEPRRTHEVAELAGYSGQTARKYLPRLRRLGLVHKGPRGYYRITDRSVRQRQPIDSQEAAIQS